MEKQAVSMTLKGRVQGVGFRWFTVNAAKPLGIQGWVRNEPDGSVRVVAVGDIVSMDAFREKLRKGPAFGRVDQLDEELLDELPTFADFSVRYS